MLNRRGLLLGLTSALAAPAIVHAGNLMPIKIFAERIWMGDMFFSAEMDAFRVALQSGYSDQPIYWSQWTSVDEAQGYGGRVTVQPEHLPVGFYPARWRTVFHKHGEYNASA